MLDIQQLKENATFSQTTLNTILESVKGNYEKDKQIIFESPQQMVNGLESLFAAGWKAGSRYTHIFHMPSYFAVYLTKPIHQQQSELADLLQAAEESYRQELAQNKQTLIEAIAIDRVQKLEASEKQKAEKVRSDRYAKELAIAAKELELTE